MEPLIWIGVPGLVVLVLWIWLAFSESFEEAREIQWHVVPPYRNARWEFLLGRRRNDDQEDAEEDVSAPSVGVGGAAQEDSCSVPVAQGVPARDVGDRCLAPWLG